MDQDFAPQPQAPAPARPDHDAVAAAIERRLQAQRQQAAATAGSSVFDANHEKRQELRRLVDPGILRPNARKVALESLKTLLKLAQNIIDHPDEPKYQKFKTTNPTIQRVLIEPRGTLEFAVAMGFRPEVENFQPAYQWNKRYLTELKLGAEVLKEALDREEKIEERTARKLAEEKAAKEAAVAKVKQAFYDDRKGRAITDEREKLAREAAVARRAAGIASPEPEIAVHSPRRMPGSGHTLSGDVIDVDDDDEDEAAAARRDNDSDED